MKGGRYNDGMMTPQEIQTQIERILLKVAKPGRYVGGELNSIHKVWEEAEVRTALAFPDIYDLGVPNVGIKILYDQINQRTDALAERVYAPWRDMEAEMRAHSIPLYTLESFHPLADFDVLGFTLPYETLYTNALNMLNLAGLPVRSAERGPQHPLVIAGGHSTMNPEPMHAFIDAFVIGEGEEVIHEILEAVKTWKAASPRSRQELLLSLVNIPGVYVPSFYESEYQEDGTLLRTRPILPQAPAKIVKRMVAKLPPPPVKFIVPNIESVHNRASVEIMRGCTRGCRFCQAGMVVRPVRERSVDEVLQACQDAIANTGFEELALLSLSSSDYSHISELVEKLGQAFGQTQLSIGLPSLRIESVSVDLMDKLQARRGSGSGFTLAPEAASERMRRIINKFIPDEQILVTAREIYSRGWSTLKLYFMIGHPSETLEDVQAIADLCKRVLAEGRKAIGMKAHLNVGVSTFIPKPQTPFQWVSADTEDQIRQKQALLRRELRDRNIKLSLTAPQDSLLEAWLARGDRRMGEVIFRAWQHGAAFDAWNEERRFDAWQAAFVETGLDPAFYTHRVRRLDEVFPWDHISTAVRKEYLFQDFRLSLEGEIRADCRQQCYACGILPTFNSARRQNPGDYWKCPEIKSRPASGRSALV